MSAYVTHDGAFHCDDVFGYAILKIALPIDDEHDEEDLRRTRDPQMIAEARIVWDVGATYDPDRGRFDHHMPGAPCRPCGTPYSSAGLLWRKYGPRAVLNVIRRTKPPRPLVHEIADIIDHDLVRLIDMADNGRRLDMSFADPNDRQALEAMTLPGIVAAFNPPWDADPQNWPRLADRRFIDAARFVAAFLESRIDAVRADLAARQAVLDAHARSADPRILELPRTMPWAEAALDAGLPVFYAVYPDAKGTTWMVNATPTAPGSFEQKLPLPAAWAGLRDAELARVSGVPDAVFCHLGRFIAGARSKEGALTMARTALAAAPVPLVT